MDPSKRIYVKTKQICYQYAVGILKIDVPNPRHLITVVNDEDTAVFCLAFGVLVTPRFMMTAAVVHEMAHSFNLGHSYSDVNTKVFSHADVGEYDDRYDLMSTANAHMYRSAEFGLVGPGFNGPHLDYLGWLPSYRIYFFGRQDSDRGSPPETSIRLSSLSRAHRQTSEWLLVLIPYDRDDPQKVYTVEFRTQENLDAGIRHPVVIVHQISRRDNAAFLYSKLLNQGGQGPSYELHEGGEWKVPLDVRYPSRFIRVTVDWIDEKAATAQVTVFSSFAPTACMKGEVQRAAFEFDLPCVSVAEKEEVQKQNKKSPSRRSVNTGRCLPGYVPRKAGPEDNVCVTEAERQAVQDQNQRWQAYREFYTMPTFGLNSCQRGYVWRQVDPYDYVCVDQRRQEEVQRQDELHDSRRSQAPNAAPSECADGFAWRQATPSDDVCVTESERLQAERENAKSAEKLVYQRFFNADNKLQP